RSEERSAAPRVSNSSRNLKFLRRDCIQSPHLDVMLPKPEKMKILKQSIGDGRILICVALVFANAGLFIFSPRPKSKSEAEKTPANAAIFDNSLALVLGPQIGNSPTDREISQLQQRTRKGINGDPWLRRHGCACVAKARESFDPGFYKLAEQCARSIEMRNPQSQEAMLLRAHVLQNLHRFKESETLARHLIQQRGLSFDYGLLGDALMEQ